MQNIIYNNIPCIVLVFEELDSYLVVYKGEHKWIYKCSLGYGEIIHSMYFKKYSFNGKSHRDEGPAIIYSNGDLSWNQNGQRHRENGPAIEYANGTKSWFQKGKLHRLDGPAIEKLNGEKEYYISGIRYNNERKYRRVLKEYLKNNFS